MFSVSVTQDALLQACAGTKLKPEFGKLTVQGDDLSQSMKRTFGFCIPTLGDSSEGVAGPAQGERQKCIMRNAKDN